MTMYSCSSLTEESPWDSERISRSMGETISSEELVVIKWSSGWAKVTFIVDIDHTMNVEAGCTPRAERKYLFSMRERRIPDHLVNDGGHLVGKTVFVAAIFLRGDGCSPLGLLYVLRESGVVRVRKLREVNLRTTRAETR